MADNCVGCKVMTGPHGVGGIACHIALGLVLAAKPELEQELCKRHGVGMRGTLELAHKIAADALGTAT